MLFNPLLVLLTTPAQIHSIPKLAGPIGTTSLASRRKQSGFIRRFRLPEGVGRMGFISFVAKIHEIMGILVKLHATSENKGVLPTALLYDIAKFTQILETNALWIEVGVGIVFGGINCGAWHAIFPTTGERLLWQYCSVLITVLPVIIVFAILADTFPEYVPLFTDTAARRFGEGLHHDPIIALTVPVYIMSRVVMLILPLTSLRALPEAAFVDIDWTTFLPHV
ncbi:hypothetical protein C8J57DRAFT_1230912 [Mycena rebaudengoi]|nr:hypothetical protein C8J57DRAFT_1230912 [Mycena rebaudengoi]